MHSPAINDARQIATSKCGRCHLTFDMSGRRKHAKRDFGCPLDGGVRLVPQGSNNYLARKRAGRRTRQTLKMAQGCIQGRSLRKPTWVHLTKRCSEGLAMGRQVSPQCRLASILCVWHGGNGRTGESLPGLQLIHQRRTPDARRSRLGQETLLPTNSLDARRYAT